MTLPILIREMLPEENSMVLSDWKKGLWDARPDWGRALQSDEWWALINHVIDRVSLPSCAVWMACHRDEPTVPLCWVAVRDGAFLHMHARSSVHREPELAAEIERDLLAHDAVGAQGRLSFNPYLELKRPEPKRKS